ncbi:alpha/beta hydrolase [Veronia pacifica]|uniref:Cob(I)alamin adenolsyltransferase n=1 Tax=Veronia pacifica TaxID=1080227 RepID=A0A1C3EF28_9GAMM|nr:alpha/beta hydrolase [Veronia pacifica]ODA31829.1 cob(I)alamin adenolsyltransferase [Veronia pacifica]
MKVVLLHGLYMHGVTLIPLAKQLKAAGHETLTITYNTVKPDVDSIFAKIDYFIAGEPEAAIVAHSMGGIIARTYLEAGSENSQLISTVVTLGTPHKGSHVADFFTNIGFGWALYKSKKYLLPNHDASWTHKAKLYSLAGNAPVGISALFNKGESDGTVLVEETKVPGMTDFELFRLNHFTLLISKEVYRKVLDVLSTPPGKAA